MPDYPADPVNPETDPGLKAHIDRGVDDRLRDLFIGDPDAWSRLKTAAAQTRLDADGVVELTGRPSIP